MKKMGLTIAALAAVLGSLVFFQNCGSKSSDSSSATGSATATATTNSTAINGTYRVTQWTCGNVNILTQMSYAGVVGASFAVSGNSATQTLAYGNGCLLNQALGLTYPDPAHITASEGATSCAGACAPNQCAAIAAPAGIAPYIFALTSSGSTLSLARTITAADLGSSSLYRLLGCAQGDALALVLAP